MDTPIPTPPAMAAARQLAAILINPYGEAMYSREQSTDYIAQHLTAFSSAELSALRAELAAAKAELAAQKINADFWLAHEKNQNTEFEKDYLAIWQAVKQPDKTVLESVLALRADLAAKGEEGQRYRDALELMVSTFRFHSRSNEIVAVDKARSALSANAANKGENGK